MPAASGPPSRASDATASRARASDAALDRHAARLRRSRPVYFAIVGVVVIGLAVFATVAYARGEAAHTTLHTVAHPPSSPPTASTATEQHEVWHTGDRLALGTPYDGGTVVTYSTHTVRGRDARTGRQTWSYTRTDRTVCNAVVIGATTIAVYAVHHDCDEVTALDSGTGKRDWTRTLDENGVTLNGPASFQWTLDTILIWSPGAMYAIDPSSGIDRWTYQRYGCAIDNAVLGTSGALISQDCTHVRCKGVKFCGHGQQLLLRDGQASTADTSKPNFDQIIWNDVGNTDVPLSAGSVVSALNRTTGRLDTVSGTSGKPIVDVTLPAASSGVGGGTAGNASAVDTSDGAVVWAGGHTSVVAPRQTTLQWSTPTTAAPTLTSDADPPLLATAVVVAPVPGGIATLDPSSGKATTYDLPGLGATDASTRAFPLSSGFLVGTRSGTAVYG